MSSLISSVKKLMSFEPSSGLVPIGLMQNVSTVKPVPAIGSSKIFFKCRKKNFKNEMRQP